MDRWNRIPRAACMALTAALMAGCTAFVAVRAMGFEIAWLGVYAVALVAALAVQLGRRGMAWTITAVAAVALGLALLLGRYFGSISAMLADFRETGGLSRMQLAGHIAAGRGMALIAALLLGALFAGLLRATSGTPLALMLLLAAVICSLAMNEDMPLALALPGLIAGVAAFALPPERRREGMRPLLLLPALVLSVLALALSPQNRLTWEPLENLAMQLRAIVDDYVHFTEQRLPFTIHEKGYDRAGMIGDDVVAMLGGPADPDDAPVLRVESNRDVLLRGTIKRSYTGYSWVDDQAKARYLYYDFTHRRVRSAVFGAEAVSSHNAFTDVHVSVEVLSPGTSTLFVPAHMQEFDMDLSDAVYYNSTGEIFLTREVEPGDRYSLTARTPVGDGALIAAASRSWEADDPSYESMLAEYTALPGGIEDGVYALAAELTRSATTDAEKALAIQNHLASNYRYTLDGRHPEGNRDFVSWFLLDEKQGYCSYFASAMAVMCRMSGLPARYVEGYYVPANDGATVLTGRNAHAWVEVYLKGMGWTAFDPTARAVENQRGGSSGSYAGDDGGETPFGNDDVTDQGGDSTPDVGSSGDEPTPDAGSSSDEPTPTPDSGDSGGEPTPDPDDGSSSGEPTPSPDSGSAGSEPTPSPDNGDSGGEPTPSPDSGSSGGEPTPDPGNSGNDGAAQDEATPPPPEGQDNPPPPNDSPKDPPEESRTWLWILLAVLAVLALSALLALWLRRRLIATDPIQMCAGARSSAMAALILYRAILTLLAQIGLVPMSGETPEAFAARAVQALPNADYGRFVADVTRSRYSGRSLSRQSLEAGRRAYADFLHSMRRSERLRYTLRRVLHGIGDVERIP